MQLRFSIVISNGRFFALTRSDLRKFRTIQNMPLYFAQRLHANMKKNAIVRGIMVGQSEENLLWVRVEFRKLANASLYSTIQKEFKGDLQFALLCLCRSEDI